MREAERETESRIAVDVGARPRLSLLVMGEQGVFTYPLPDEGVVRIGRAGHCEIENLSRTTSTLEEVFVKTVEAQQTLEVANASK